MGFPDRKELNRALKKLEKTEGTLALSDTATPLEKLRWEICQHFIAYKMSHNLSQKELAEILEVGEAKISKILRHRIDGFSTDRLINLYSSLDPEVSLKLS